MLLSMLSDHFYVIHCHRSTKIWKNTQIGLHTDYIDVRSEQNTRARNINGHQTKAKIIPKKIAMVIYAITAAEVVLLLAQRCIHFQCYLLSP